MERVQAAWRLPVESADMAGKKREASVLPRGRGLRGRKVTAIDCMYAINEYVVSNTAHCPQERKPQRRQQGRR